VTGSKIQVSTLATVPIATAALHATSADTAESFFLPDY
jgi:hypothetical protein